MSKAYTNAVASAPSKQESREKIAHDIQSLGRQSCVIHYLGGAHGETPFEELFDSRKKRTTFVRYERQCTYSRPASYAPTRRGDMLREKLESEYGYFVRGDVFKYAPVFSDVLSDAVNHYWLDFCGTPTVQLMDNIYHTVLTSLQEQAVCYVTFYLNSRGCTNSKRIYAGKGKSIEDRANAICEEFKIDMDENISCEVFETHYNGPSPMGVLKFTNTNKTIKRTVEEYLNLSNKGLSNKTIARIWNIGIMQVAGLAATAKKKGMI